MSGVLRLACRHTATRPTLVASVAVPITVALALPIAVALGSGPARAQGAAQGTTDGGAVQGLAPSTAPDTGNGVVQIPPVTVDSTRITAETPVTGYVAQQDRAATKTDTPLLETPQSVSVITRDQMTQQDVHTLNQAVRYTSGVAAETRGGIATRYDQLTIRGFSADTYLDGLKLLDNGWYAIPQIDPYLLERVDVLKGPSSVLYGQAQAGGLINMVSKMPTVTPLHEVGIEFGNFAHLQSTFDFSGPLNDSGTLLYRFTGIGSRENGQVSGTKNERLALAPAITWRPDGDTSLTLHALYQHDPYATSYGAVPPQGTVLYNPFGTLPMNFYDGDYGFEKFDRTQVALGYRFEKRIDDTWSVRSSARWFWINQDYASVYDAGLEADDRTMDRATAASRDRMGQVTLDNNVQAKFATGPVEHTAIAGFDFQHLDSTYLTGFGAAPTLDIWAPDHNQAIVQPNRYSVDVTGNQYGLYVQDQLRFGRVSLTLSGRQDWFDNRQANTTYGTVTTQSQSAFTGRAALSYLFDSGVAPYVSYAESFTPIYGVGADGEAFQPERGRQYEVGVKYQPTGMAALFTAALFDLTRTNLLTANPLTPGFSVQSGEARSRGVELEARGALTDALSIVATYTYLDTIYTKDESGLEGKHLPAVPNHMGSVWAYYTVPAGTFEGLSLGAGVRYVGPSFSSDNSFQVPGVALVDATIRYDLGHAWPRAKGAELHVNASNLLDQRYVASCYYGNWCAYGYQRQVFAGLTYRW
ncbi:MAG: TonB-dependent siderophore receptor [Rhodospirillales bacterium]|nr:TonB-dependent siderophore receptor [Rhodospirillales bacterium]MBN8928040.1 TonB-dependent siderophore receptor [Rhodospirillales bacterium]